MTDICSAAVAKEFRLKLLKMLAKVQTASMGKDGLYINYSAMVQVLWETAANDGIIILWDKVQHLVIPIIKMATAEVGKTKIEEQIAHASGQSVVINHKKISEVVDWFAEEVSSVPMTLQTCEDICTKLLSFSGDKFKNLQSCVPTILCHYFLDVEIIISLMKEQQRCRLMSMHGDLVRRLGVQKIYSEITTTKVDALELAKLLSIPTALIEIIVEYTTLTFSLSEDVDVIYDRLLMIDFPK